MKVTTTSILSIAAKEAVISLWNSEYPQQLKHADAASFDNYLSGLGAVLHFLLTDEAAMLQGWAITFSRNEERWFAIILNRSTHGKGLGTFLLQALKEKERVLNGWVINTGDDVKANGEAYRSPLAFYLKNDFVLYPEIRLETTVMSAVKIRWTRK